MKTQLNLSQEERSHLKQLILNQQLTDALDFLRVCARRQFLTHRTRISEEQIIEYLKTWQRILCVSQTSDNDQQISDTA